MSDRKFSEQEQIRRNKLTQLVAHNNNPFVIAKFQRTHYSNQLIIDFQQYSKEQLHEQNIFVWAAGRIRTSRAAGKASFATIQDQNGIFQIYVREDALGLDNYQAFLNFDLGDIVGVEGKMMKTNTGELTIRVEKITLLAKALRPLPDKYHGIVDIEERYRRRYVDLIMNPETKNVFQKRSKVLSLIRKFFDDKGYLEVETPVLQAIHGGATAKPFTTFHNTLERDFYLRVATELPLKKLIVGGFDGVYEIGRLFRNEGMDTRHNPEFTSVEVYVAYQDMEFMMQLTEDVIRYVITEILGTETLEYGGQKLNFATS